MKTTRNIALALGCRPTNTMCYLGGAMPILAGCSSVPLPPEAAAARVVPFSSTAIEVHRPRFVADKGDLELEVYGLRQRKAETTADSHLDLVFMDPQGRALLVDTASFNPRMLAGGFAGIAVGAAGEGARYWRQKREREAARKR